MDTTPMDWQTFITIAFRHPVIGSGDPNSDVWLEYVDLWGSLSWIFLALSIISIGIAFARGIPAYKAQYPHRSLPRYFRVLLTLALAALLVTHGVRFEHKRIAYLASNGLLDAIAADRDVQSPFGIINQADKDNGLIDAIQVRHREKLAALERDVNEEPWTPPYRAGNNDQRQMMPRDRVEDKTMRQARDEVRRESGVILPYLKPRKWPTNRLLVSSWDYHDMLALTPSGFFWTAQWYAGFLAWMLYVIVECERRRLSKYRLGMAFICFGAFGGSLAAAQCLFFALIGISVQPVRADEIWVFKSWAPGMVQAISAVLLHMFARFVQGRIQRDPRVWRTAEHWMETTRTVKAFAFITPLLVLLPRVKRDGKYIGMQRVVGAKAKRALTASWYLVALAGLVMQWDSLRLLFAKSFSGKKRVGRRHSFFLSTETYPFEQRRNPMDHVDLPMIEFLGVLGDNLWVNALAFDVLFVAATLAYWSVAANVDARGMVRCGLLPWLDGVTEKWKIMRYHTLPEALPDVRLRAGTGSRDNHDGEESGVETEDEGGQPPRSKEQSQQVVQGKKARRARSTSQPVPVLPTPDEGRGRALKNASARDAAGQARGKERARSRSVTSEQAAQSGGQRRVPSETQTHGSASSAVPGNERIRERDASPGPDPEHAEGTAVSAASAIVPAFEELAGPGEQAGLALAMFAVGGLGMASAAVLGADAGWRRR